LKIAVGYRHPDVPNRVVNYWEGDASWLAKCEPVYIEMPGWQQSTRQIRSFAELPAQAQAFVRRVEELVETPVRFVSVGPDRDEVIHIRS
jgi:adenylosuccinate synthase